MKSKRVYIIIIIQFVLFQFVYAQLKPIITLTEEDGLAGNEVKDVIRDKNGILWIGTELGLSKFDGKGFKNFYRKDGLPSNRVWAVETDQNGFVYIGCYYGGLAVMRNDSIVKILHTKKPYANSIRILHYSKYYNKLLVGTDYGVYVLDSSRLTPVIYEEDSITKSSILSFPEQGSRIFFTVHGGNSSGFYELFINNDYVDKSFAKKISINSYFASTTIEDTLYYSYYNVIHRYLPVDARKEYSSLSIDKQFLIWCMTPFKDNQLLLGGFHDGRYKGNIKFFDTQRNCEIKSKYDVKASSVWSFYNDTIDNNYWICGDNGLTCLTESPFTYWEYKGEDRIKDIAITNNRIKILSGNQLSEFTDDTIKKVLSKEEIYTKIETLKNKYPLKTQQLFATWLYKNTFELSSLINDRDKTFINTPIGSIAIQDFKTYYPFPLGTFLSTKSGGIYNYQTYRNLLHFPQIKTSFETEEVLLNGKGLRGIFEIMESNNVYYFASEFHGIYAIIENKVHYLDESNSKNDNYLTDIDQDSKGNIWCSSANGNLFRIGFKDSLKVQQVLNQDNSGLIGNNCKWLIFNDKYLYVGTNKGLNVISIENLYSKNPKFEYFFNEHNGYGFISAVSPIKDKEGNIYVHTTNKLIKIDADFSIKSHLDIKIRDLQVNNQESVVEKINGKKLPYSINEISFNFFAVKYPIARNLKYRYKVNNGEWNKGNMVNLHSLRAGNYELVIEVHDKETNKDYSQYIHFFINKPFYQTWWFILLASLALIAIVYLIMMSRMKTLKKFHKEKVFLITRNSELNLRSLQIQMNPHFIFNALNSIQALIVLQNTKNTLLYLSNLAGIIRINLENANKEYIHLHQEIEFLKEYTEIEKIRFKEKLNVNFNNMVKDSNVLIPPMLVQPVIENSIKHGIRNLKGNGIVNIDFQLENSILVVTVEDNGVGRDFTKNTKIKNHNSVGTDIIHQRLEILNQKHHTEVHEIETIDLFQNNKPSGTKVIIKLLAKRSG